MIGIFYGKPRNVIDRLWYVTLLERGCMGKAFESMIEEESSLFGFRFEYICGSIS